MKHFTEISEFKIRRWVLSFAILMFSAFQSSGQTVMDYIANSQSHTTLETALIEAELDDDLNGPGPFTVFAPTDAAFNLLPPGTLSDPTGELAQILQYHILEVDLQTSDLINGQVITTMLGKDIEITVTGTDVFVNGVQVTVADEQRANGVVHVIDAVLTPPNTVVDIINDSPNHAILEDALVTAGLNAPLNQTGSFTVFAPTDAAFNALTPTTRNNLLTDAEGNLTSTLLYHVIQGERLSASLSDGEILTTLSGKEIKITVTGSGVFINNALITTEDIPAGNGVVHVIDALLTPPETILDIINNSADHSTLASALQASGLDATLNQTGSYTVFAPTNAAFDALPDGMLNDLMSGSFEDLTDILLYHMASGTTLSTSLSDGQNITTFHGDDVVVTLSGSDVYINNALISSADNEATNGVVHVIDAVLTPGTVTNISDNPENITGIKVFPNPSSSYFNIAFTTDKAQPASLEVFNMLGQKVFARDLGILNAGEHSFGQTVSGFDSGAYFVIIKTNERRHVTKLKISK